MYDWLEVEERKACTDVPAPSRSKVPAGEATEEYIDVCGASRYVWVIELEEGHIPEAADREGRPVKSNGVPTLGMDDIFEAAGGSACAIGSGDQCVC